MSKIKLSKFAEKIIYQTIKESGIPKDKGLRITEFKDGLTLVTDRFSKDDHVIKKDKDILIIINKELEEQIGEAIIDINNISDEPKLIIIKGERSN